MTTQEALKILQQFQNWRTGKYLRSMTDVGIEPREVTNAIDVAIGALRKTADQH